MFKKKNSIAIYKDSDFEYMREAGRIAANTLDFIAPYVKVGVSTLELDELCHDFIIDSGAIPAPLGYRGYPKSICTSRNSVVCHGIPDEKVLIEGDIVNIDVTTIYNGWYGDTSRMFLIGEKIPKQAELLCNRTYEILLSAISVVKPGVNLNAIGKKIEEKAHKFSYSVVRDYCGHGIGREFHAEPSVFHFYLPHCDVVLEQGMFFTIEPMINIGKPDTVLLKSDGWTVRTKDFSLSAQFEHTMGVTSDGVEVFTYSSAERQRFHQ